MQKRRTKQWQKMNMNQKTMLETAQATAQTTVRTICQISQRTAKTLLTAVTKAHQRMPQMNMTNK